MQCVCTRDNGCVRAAGRITGPLYTYFTRMLCGTGVLAYAPVSGCLPLQQMIEVRECRHRHGSSAWFRPRYRRVNPTRVTLLK